MNELGLSQVEMAARCCSADQNLFPEEQQPQITRERIARILMHCKAAPGKSAARVISSQELHALASALQVSIEWLAGRDLVLWDPLSDPQRAGHILHIMNEHEDTASEILFWAEYLICSFETPEFMHRHHEALFSELDILGAHDDKRKVVQAYDSIGMARRKRLLDPMRRRRKLVQFIFASDLERIALGTSEYASIRKDLRRACLENVCDLIADSSLGLELVIISDKETGRVRPALRDYDSVGVFDESFVLWRYHSGRIAWSEDPIHTRRYRRLLKELQKCSGDSATDALKTLSKLARSVRC